MDHQYTDYVNESLMHGSNVTSAQKQVEGSPGRMPYESIKALEGASNLANYAIPNLRFFEGNSGEMTPMMMNQYQKQINQQKMGFGIH